MSSDIDWNALMESNLIDKQSLNHLILNYLIFEGYENSTIKFAKEIGIDLNEFGKHHSLEVNDNDNDEEEEDSTDLKNTKEQSILMGINSIKIRNEIKLNILNGEVQQAINKLNLNYPDLLEQNNFLYFKLLLLNLIEMIRNNNELHAQKGVNSGNDDEDVNQEEFVMNIIKFAQEKLTNKAIKNIKFMEELELTMTLLLYSNNKELLPSRLNELFEFKLRRDIADLVNKSILVGDSNNLTDLNYKKKFYEKKKFNDDEQNNSNNNIDDDNDNLDVSTTDEIGIDDDDDGFNNQIIDSNLKKLIKLWIWSENQVHDKNIEFPRLNLD